MLNIQYSTGAENVKGSEFELVGPIALFYLYRCVICQRQREMGLAVSDRGKPLVICTYCGGVQVELTARFMRDH